MLTLKNKITQINNLTSQLKELEKEQRKPKVSRRKEIVIRAEIENRKIKINETKNWFFEKINKLTNF